MKHVFLFAFLFFPAMAQANELGLDKTACSRLVEAAPAADVEYKPGVDVHGKPVLEADLTPAVVTPPETYSFALTVNAARQLGIEGTEGLADVGTVTVDKDGKVSFNGQPLEGEALSALKEACTAK